jgi:hypothetical protein
MPIHLRQNPYNGVNAHLHSHLQQKRGGWQSYHGTHIAHLRDLLDAQLPPHYVAFNEDSLQIGEWHEMPSAPVTVPDILVSRQKAGGQVIIPEGAVMIAPTKRYSMVEAPDEDEGSPRAIVIYTAEGGLIGQPCTRIELLSPANKPGRSGAALYHQKREETLYAGLTLVEIDYLHETRSPFTRLPSYPAKEDGAYPYTIIVNEPHPSYREGAIDVYGFYVDDPIPPVPIPLMRGDVIVFDFGAAYKHTDSLYRSMHVVLDYEQLPACFDTYSPADQARIRARMQAIAHAQ